MNPDDPRHGSYAGAVAHYLSRVPTCQPCKEAAATYRRNRRARLYLARSASLEVNPTGSVRRIQALVAIGHSMRTIDERMGWAWGTTSRFIVAGHKTTHRTTALKIAAVYDELCMSTPTGTYALRNRRLAARKGWSPPLAWDDIDDPDERPKGNVRPSGAMGIDEVAVQRVMDGRAPERVLSYHEREEVVRRLHAQGLPDPQIGKQIGIDPRTVFRIRSRLGLAPVDSWRAVVPNERHNELARNARRKPGAA